MEPDDPAEQDPKAKAAEVAKRLLDIPYCPHTPHPAQARFLLDFRREVLFGGALGGGKVGRLRHTVHLHNGTIKVMEHLVLTPFGFKAIDDIEVGDKVCNPDGTVATVVMTHFPTDQQFYNVEFSDGAIVEVGADHLWAVRDRKFRKRRKVKPAPVPEGLGAPTEFNMRLHRHYEVMTTDQVIERMSAGRAMAVPLTEPVRMTGSPGKWPMLPPYVLGVLIGDGHLGASITWTKPDRQVAEEVQAELSADPKVAHLLVMEAGNDLWRISGPTLRDEGQDSPQELVRRVGLDGKRSWEKFIPKSYLRRPVADRWALAQGLFDTDGYADERGHVEYSTSSEQLAEDVQHLLRSLGFTAKIGIKEEPTYEYLGEKLIGRPSYRIYVRGRRTADLFRLERKKSRCNEVGVGIRSTGRKTDLLPDNPIVSITPTAVADGKCITVDNPNGLYISNDFVVTHNSDALLMSALMFAKVPGYAALILRKRVSDLEKSGALIPRAQEWMSHHPDVRWMEQKKRFVFPSGAILQFGYIDSPTDHLAFEGTEWSFIGIDEVSQHRRSQYIFMFSRLRRPKDATGDHPLSRVPLRYRSTTNPGTRWVYERFVADPDDPDEEFEYEADRVRTNRAFHPSRLEDNPSLDGEEYREGLGEMTPLMQQMLLDGEWNIQVQGNVFDREWFQPVITEIPGKVIKTVRYWDLAATAEAQAPGKDPDWSCGALCHRLADNRMVVQEIIRERMSPAELESLLQRTAERDGPYVDIWVEQEPGAGGKIAVNHIQRNVLGGRKVKTHPKRVDKVTAAGGWAAFASNQRGVLLMPGPWNAKLFAEMDTFPSSGHDDLIDAISGGYYALFGKSVGAAAVAMAGANRDQAARDRAAKAADPGKPSMSIVHQPSRARVFKRPLTTPPSQRQRFTSPRGR